MSSWAEICLSGALRYMKLNFSFASVAVLAVSLVGSLSLSITACSDSSDSSPYYVNEDPYPLSFESSSSSEASSSSAKVVQSSSSVATSSSVNVLSSSANVVESSSAKTVSSSSGVSSSGSKMAVRLRWR